MSQPLKFEWHPAKDAYNRDTHGISFEEAKKAFDDPVRIILKDVKHSDYEERLFCYGMVKGVVLTVRFTMRKDMIRIIGAAYWREGKEMYDEENNL